MTAYLEQQPIAEWVLSPVDRAPAAAASSRHASLPGLCERVPAVLLADLVRCLLQQSALATSPQQFQASEAGLLQA